MDRNFSRHVSRWTFLALGAVMLSTGAGCAVLPMVGWLITDGKDVPPEYTENGGLKGKKVAVVCRATGTSSFRHAHVPAKLAEAVAKLLKTNVDDIKIVDPRKVADWTDNNQNQPYTEIGEALKADVVVGIELDDFRLQKGQTLYHGEAQVTLRVYDLKSDEPGEVTWTQTIPQMQYPTIGPVPANGNLGQFRREFISVLAGQIARKFYAHESNQTFAMARAR